MRGAADLKLSSKVAANALKRSLFSPGDTVVIAHSGGADSTALLHILARLQVFALKLIVAHLNHSIRGNESDADEEFSRKLAESYRLPFESRRVDILKIARDESCNLEEAARDARIAFFDEMRRRWNASAIALAHNADDQAETLLIRLLRGSGSTGLSGMRFRNDRGYVRPLLDSSRREIEEYLLGQGLEWREDSSNRNTDYIRNRIRHHLLPDMKSYNPAFVSSLGATAELLADEDDFLEETALEAAERVCIFNDQSTICSIEGLLSIPLAIRRRIYRLMFRRASGTMRRFSHIHTEAIENMIKGEKPNVSIDLPQDIILTRRYGRIEIAKKSDNPLPRLETLMIPGEGVYRLGNGATLLVGSHAGENAEESGDGGLVRLDPAKAPFPWTLRAFIPGDRIRPSGMQGSKKVKDILIERKIPLHLRKLVPVVFSGDRALWICGIRASAEAVADLPAGEYLTARYLHDKSH